jgi:hypothetical protein
MIKGKFANPALVSELIPNRWAAAAVRRDPTAYINHGRVLYGLSRQYGRNRNFENQKSGQGQTVVGQHCWPTSQSRTTFSKLAVVLPSKSQKTLIAAASHHHPGDSRSLQFLHQ